MFNDREAFVITAHDPHKRRYREESMDADDLLRCIVGVAAVRADKQGAWTAASIEGVLVLDADAAEPSDPSLPPIPWIFDPTQACVDGPVDQPGQPQAHTRVYNATSLPVAKVAQIRPRHSHGNPRLVSWVVLASVHVHVFEVGTTRPFPVEKAYVA